MRCNETQWDCHGLLNELRGNSGRGSTGNGNPWCEKGLMKPTFFPFGVLFFLVSRAQQRCASLTHSFTRSFPLFLLPPPPSPPPPHCLLVLSARRDHQWTRARAQAPDAAGHAWTWTLSRSGCMVPVPSSGWTHARENAKDARKSCWENIFCHILSTEMAGNDSQPAPSAVACASPPVGLQWKRPKSVPPGPGLQGPGREFTEATLDSQIATLDV